MRHTHTHTPSVCLVHLQTDRILSSSVSFARTFSGGDVRGAAWKRSSESRDSELPQIPELLFFFPAAAGLGSAREETGAAIFDALDLLTCRSLKDAHM